MSDFGRRIVMDKPFETALSAAVDSLHASGFVVTGQLDVRRAIADAMLGDCRRYVLLTAVSTEMLARAIKLDLDAGVSVPCHVAVYELADGRSAVAADEPFSEVAESAGWQRDSPELARVAMDLGEQLGAALSGLSPHVPRRAA